MKVIVSTDSMASAFKSISRIKPRLRPCMRIAAVGNNGTSRLVLERGDGQTWIRREITSADCIKPGAVWATAEEVGKAFKGSLSATLTLDLSDSTLNVRDDEAAVRVFGYTDDAAEKNTPHGWPWPEGAGIIPLGIRIPAAQLAAGLPLCLRHAARENSRYAINGLLLVSDGDGKGRLVATDGRRLIVYDVDTDGPKWSGIIHADTAKAVIAEVKGNLDGDITVEVRDGAGHSTVAFSGGGKAGGWSVLGVPVEGSFPPYMEVIPKDTDKSLTVKADDFAREIKRAAAWTNEESRGVGLDLQPEAARDTGPICRVTARKPECGEYTGNLNSAKTYIGEPIKIGFNPAFLDDLIAACPSDYLTLHFKSPNKPTVMRSGPVTVVVMPVNLA